MPPAHCLERIANRDTEKGDPQASARIAGILAAKRTDELLPLCHPLPIHAAEVHFDVRADRVVIEAEVHTIGPTGVEMEALTAASIAALTLYDMLKPYAEPDELSHRRHPAAGKNRRQEPLPAHAQETAGCHRADGVQPGRRRQQAGYRRAAKSPTA